MKKHQSNKNSTSRTSFVRTDLSVNDLMAAHPSSRWDVEFWNPSYDKLFKLLESSRFEICEVDSLMLPGTDGITYGQVGRREYDENGKVQYLQVSNIKATGVDVYEQYARIKSGSHNDPERSRLQTNDLLLINGGVGSLGRCCILVKKDSEFNISQDIDRVRFQNPSTGYYVAVFLNGTFGQQQISRFTKGVSGQTKIGFDHVRAIKIPILDEAIHKNIEKEYKKMSSYHDKAMEAKKKNDEAGYKKNIETAEKILKDLIAKTEAVIRGERKDVI